MRHIGPPSHNIAPGRTPRITQPWYADDVGAGGKVGRIMEHFQDSQARGLLQGYLTEPTNSILVGAPRIIARAEEFFRGMGIKIVTGSWYLGSFIRDRAANEIWLVEKVHGWTESVKTLPGISRKHPQSAYTGLQKSLQQEWVFV